MSTQQPIKLDFGVVHYDLMLPPIIKRNYGKWKYHEIIKPGILKHVSETGEEFYTVRAGAPKFASVDTVRKLCDLADKYCDGYLRFTSRHNIEFLISKKENIDGLIADLKKMGLPVGGTGNSMASIIQCTAWMHCHTAATDAAGIGKSVYDGLFEYFQRMDLPAKLKIAISGCLNMCGAVHCSDIAILGVHRVPPKVIDEIVSKACEIPSLIAVCPTYAIKPNPKAKSITIDPDKCMYCGICYGMCPGVPLADPKNDGVSIWVGGKVSSTRSGPMFSRLVVPYLPNNPPRWPEVVDVVKKIVNVWVDGAKKDERMGEWIERIGWGRFFKITGIPFTDKHIDDYVFAIPSMSTGAQVRL
ncbi:MAG: dissimilatory-type sulfite reductase subunit beta [Euryarchaeota archaeon]|nr:dissimilatory-type sulfite reductase subunit beta [Euryarchaeota archaeon]